VLPAEQSWFALRFGTAHCAEAQMNADDCLGPRLALTYGKLASNLPASFALTLQDLINEGLTNFEATNYNERCPGPIRIVPSVKLIGDLTTTVFLPRFSDLVKNQEPVYVLWSYGGTKETTLAFFVYSEGAFRYVGLPREASVKDYEGSKTGQGLSEALPQPQY